MEYKVIFYDESQNVISDEVWHGTSVNNVKFWVDLALNEIQNSLNKDQLSYEIFELTEKQL